MMTTTRAVNFEHSGVTITRTDISAQIPFTATHDPMPNIITNIYVKTDGGTLWKKHLFHLKDNLDFSVGT